MILTIACSQNVEKIEKKHLDKAIKETNIDIDDYQWGVVLPGLGCHGCIQVAEVFMRGHITNK